MNFKRKKTRKWNRVGCPCCHFIRNNSPERWSARDRRQLLTLPEVTPENLETPEENGWDEEYERVLWFQALDRFSQVGGMLEVQ